MIRLLIADDHAMVRQVLRNTLREAGLHVVAEAENADDAVARARDAAPDVAILDVAMPGDVLKTIELLKQLDPAPKILVLTASADEALSVRCMKAGADGFLRKTQPAQVLLEAVQRLGRGGKYVDAELAVRLATSRPETQVLHELLSKRELQVLKRLGKAQTVTAIAADLEVSFKTVSTYRTRILEKTGFANNTDIIRYCLDHGLT